MNTSTLWITVVLASLPCFCSDIYVSSERGRRGGSKEQPFKYLADAIAKAEPGDTIHVAAGVYHGKGNSGHWVINKDNLTLLGGYDDQFSVRDPFKNRTLLEFDGSPENKTMRPAGSEIKATENASRKPLNGIVFDGFWLDGGSRNKYREDQDNPSMKLDSSPGDFLLHVKVAKGSRCVVKNCTFINPGKSAALMIQGEGGSEFDCQNNVFVNGVYHHMIVGRLGAKNDIRMKATIKNNSFLFAWHVSANGEGVVVYPFTDIDFNNNVFAFGESTAIVNDRYEELIDNRGNKTKGVNKTVKIDDNLFFMWKRGLYGWVESGQSGTRRTTNPDDLWETSINEDSGNNNLIADPGYAYNKKWIELFASRSDVADGEVTMDAVNEWRRILGLPLQGKANPNRQGYAMRYALDDVGKFRMPGNNKDKGAQLKLM